MSTQPRPVLPSELLDEMRRSTLMTSETPTTFAQIMETAAFDQLPPIVRLMFSEIVRTFGPDYPGERLQLAACLSQVAALLRPLESEGMRQFALRRREW